MGVFYSGTVKLQVLLHVCMHAHVHICACVCVHAHMPICTLSVMKEGMQVDFEDFRDLRKTQILTILDTVCHYTNEVVKSCSRCGHCRNTPAWVHVSGKVK